MKLRIKMSPVAKGRPKVRQMNGKIWTFTPTKTQVAQDTIRAFIALKNLTPFPKRTPLKIVTTFYSVKSKWLKKYVDMPYIRPDLDNLEKCWVDSLGGIIPDDAAITTSINRKRWSKRKYGYIECEITIDRRAG